MAFGLMFLFVLWHNERCIIDGHSQPAWAFFFPVRWWLLVHALAWLSALLIGPFQFSSRFRQRHLRIHRIMGRCYLGAIAISAPMGMYLTCRHNSSTIRFYVLTLGYAWLLTAGKELVRCATATFIAPAMDGSELRNHKRVHNISEILRNHPHASKL